MTNNPVSQELAELIELRPCPNPWCEPSDTLPPTLRWSTEAYVECASCGMQGPSISPIVLDDDGEQVGTRDAEADAIAAWNTRLSRPEATDTQGAVGRIDATEANDLLTYLRFAWEDYTIHADVFTRFSGPQRNAILAALSSIPNASGEATEPSAALSDEAAVERGIDATQIAMGHGLVDVGPIIFGDRKGIILRPRSRYIPVGDEGELNGDYWPVPGDVVIWIDKPEGANVILEHLTPLAALSASIPSTAPEGGEAIQADRDNAAHYCQDEALGASFKAGERDGHAYVQMFTKRRLAALTTTAQGEVVQADEASPAALAAFDEANNVYASYMGDPDGNDDTYTAKHEAAKVLDRFARDHRLAFSHPSGEVGSFQARVDTWMDACFGDAIKADRLERCDRFIEESLELVQTEPTFTADRAHALVDYVFSRGVGEPAQEVGGVKVTLAALCNTFGIDVDAAAETELARVWTKVEQIRAKQAAKPTGSALPVALSTPDTVSLKGDRV